MSPVETSDVLGMAFVAGVADDARRERGLYLTPARVARFMAGTISPRNGLVRVLDPAAGAGVLSCAVVERLVETGSKRIDLVAYEIDAETADVLTGVLDRLREWASERDVDLRIDIRRRDFILAHAEALRIDADLFGAAPLGDFDLIVANPPYFKIPKSDTRARYAKDVVHGQPNIYGLFMAVGAAMLRPGGEISVIVPRSFASGSYFQALRERFFGMVRPTRTHVFTSRQDAFGRDEVLQENVILTGVREDGWSDGTVLIGESAGIDDIDVPPRVYPLVDVLEPVSEARCLRFPSAESTGNVIPGWTETLGTLGLRVATGPVVAFRAKHLLSEVEVAGSVPLIWMNHVNPMRVTWPLGGRKPDNLIGGQEAKGLVVGAGNYVLVRRFSPKEQSRRIVAAPLFERDVAGDGYAFENHLNYVFKARGSLTPDEAFGFAAILNSRRLDAWFRSLAGNTQVSATEMRAMPLPRWEAIRELGKAGRETSSMAELDALVDRL